jgi:hypothetical protein
VAEIVKMKSTVNELEAALVLLAGDEEQLIGIRRRERGRINGIVSILGKSELQARQDRQPDTLCRTMRTTRSTARIIAPRITSRSSSASITCSRLCTGPSVVPEPSCPYTEPGK